MLKLSVNILAWNNWPTIGETLKVLAADLKGISHEIIIVDNGSTDELKDIPSADNFKIIRFKENVGISKGKNAGIKESQGEYILLLDGDIIPVPRSILCLSEWLDNTPDCHAIGFYPNKFSAQRNKGGQKHHEDICFQLYDPKPHTQAIVFYGMFRRKALFDHEILFCEEGPFGEIGYGWDDSDFFMQMKRAGIQQWVAGLNHVTGKYFHAINSSIRIMGYEKYMSTSRKRADFYRKRWGLVNG